MKYILFLGLLFCFVVPVGLLAEIYEGKCFFFHSDKTNPTIVNACDILFDGSSANLMDKVRQVAAHHNFERSEDFVDFVRSEYGVRLWKVEDHPNIGPNEVSFSPHRSFKYYLVWVLPILLCLIYVGFVIFCFCKSFLKSWRKLDFLFFAAWAFALVMTMFSHHSDREAYFLVILLPWSIIAVTRLIALRHKIAELLRLAFLPQNYFKSLILIFAAIITLCILFMTFHFCGSF